jgi:hypothetical protein
MHHHPRSRRLSRYLLASIALLLVCSLPAGSAAAHTFTRNDANDSASKIDLRSVSVAHTATSVVHSVRTWNSWTPASLQHDSFFLIGINKDDDSAYERCAFIYYTTRLRGQLSNCGAQFIRYLTVSKVNATTAKITIPKSQLGPAYDWYGASFWVGARPCLNVCRDFAPNRLPDILHDLTPPDIAMSEVLLNTWEVSDTMTFPFAFTVSDEHTGIASWTVQRRPLYSTGAWSDVVTGSGSGIKNPDIVSTGGWFVYRVVATDTQGNQDIGPSRWVFEASDVDETVGPGVFDPPATPILNAGAFGGDFVPLDDPGDSYEVTYDSPGDGWSREVKFIGPGTGDWLVELFVDGVSNGTISAADVGQAQREIIYASSWGTDVTFLFVLVSGAGFGIDAVLGAPLS